MAHGGGFWCRGRAVWSGCAVWGRDLGRAVRGGCWAVCWGSGLADVGCAVDPGGGRAACCADPGGGSSRGGARRRGAQGGAALDARSDPSRRASCCTSSGSAYGPFGGPHGSCARGSPPLGGSFTGSGPRPSRRSSRTRRGTPLAPDSFASNLGLERARGGRASVRGGADRDGSILDHHRQRRDGASRCPLGAVFGHPAGRVHGRSRAPGSLRALPHSHPDPRVSLRYPASAHRADFGRARAGARRARSAGSAPHTSTRPASAAASHGG